MQNKTLPPEQRSGNGGGKFFPALCNIVGILLILAVIAVSLPLALPRFLGYEAYNVVSGSMEPTIPMDSVVYVGEAAPETIREGDVIAFWSGDSVVTHRVVQNRTSLGEFVTKGDANNIEDIDPVPYAALIGRVEKHFPMVGRLMAIYSSSIGKMYLLLIAACGVMFNILAGRIRDWHRDKLRRKLAEELAARSAAEDLPAKPASEPAPDAAPRHAAPRRRFRWVRPLIMTILAVIFVGSGGVVLYVMHQYNVSDQLYAEASAKFTVRSEEYAAQEKEEAAGREETAPAKDGNKTERLMEVAPIQVDFDGLTAVNGDVVGWIYCEDSIIDYPVLQGADNDLYLHHTYEGEYSVSGSIFVESDNAPGFADANSIVYGHHMKNGSMFAALENWADQSYYEEHPVMWLLTPEQDYKLILLSGYHTSAYSDTYTIFKDAGEDMTTYLEEAVSKSDFTADVELNGEAHYVVLSTCAYIFDNARYVIHGMLVPVDSAGGVRIVD